MSKVASDRHLSTEERAAARLGIFGGAFDPPHRAHVAIAQKAITQLGLQKLFVLPTGDAWHKRRALQAASHRLAMTALAFADVPEVVLDTREISREGPTYTMDTLEQLQRENSDAQWFVVMGADQLLKLPLWHRWEDLVHSAIIAVAGRLGGGDWKCIEQQLPAGGILRLHLEPANVSSTEIRHRVATGLDITPWVPGPVARYIAQNHLYEKADEQDDQDRDCS